MASYGPFKEKLMGALHQAVQYFNSSGDPNESVVKAASDNDFNVDQTQRLVETFNTARTIYHYKVAADRASTFSLAESEVVIPKLFGANADPKPEKTAVAFDYSEYELKEAEYHSPSEFQFNEPKAHLDTNLDAQGFRMYRILHAQRDMAKMAKEESTTSGHMAQRLLSKVGHELGTGYQEVCQERYNRLMTVYLTKASTHMKDTWAPVMEKLSEFVPKWLRDGFSEKVAGVIEDRDFGLILDQLKEAKYWMEAEAEMSAIADSISKEASEFEREWFSAINVVLPQAKLKTAADLLSLEKASQGVESQDKKKGNQSQSNVEGGLKALSDMTSPVTTGFAGGVKNIATTLTEGGLSGLLMGKREEENKALSARLQNAQRQLILEELITNDPVLSEEDPQTVAQAYTTILNMAPDVASNKEIVRAILRQSVHSVAVSPYEAQVWTDLERNLRMITGKTDMRGKPQQEGQR